MVGWVQEIVLENFKSYEGRVRIGPFKKFTCVVGPNGAGKSNIMDAISFVLCVRNQHLRGDQHFDLIHRKEGEMLEGVDRETSVELVHVESDAIGHMHFATRTVFKRVIHPTMEARFLINDESVLRATYMRRLEAINIIPRARNFLVFQGDVEMAAHRQGKDLANFFEQVSGSAAYREEYEALVREKQQKEDTTRYLYTKRRNAINEKKRLAQQKEEADSYRQLEAERRDLQVQFVLFRLHCLAAQAEEATRRLADRSSELRTLQGNVASRREHWETLERQRAQRHLSVVQAEKSVNASRLDIERLSAESVEAQSRVGALRMRLEHFEEHMAKEKERNEKLDSQQKLLRGEEARLLEEIDRLEHASRRELRFTKEQREEFDRAQQIAAQMTTAAGGQARELESCISATARERARVQRDLREAVARRDHFAKRIGESERAVEAARNAQARDSKASREAEAKLAGFEATGRKCSDDKAQLHVERSQILKGIQDITATERQIQVEQRRAQVAADLAQMVQGVHGRVLDLCKPTQQRMKVAVNVALGGYLDAIVIDTAEGGRQCVRYLKERMLEAMTFLPLDTIRVPGRDWRLQEAVRQEHKVCHALQCINFDDSLGRLFEFLLGDVVIADDLEEGRRFVFGKLRERGLECRLVTLSGETISRDGNIAVSCDVAHAGSTRFDFATLDATRNRLEEIDRRLYAIHALETSGSSTLASLQDEARSQEVRIRESDANFARCESELQSRRQELTSADDAVKVLEPQLEQLTNDEARFLGEQRQLEEGIGQAVASHFEQLSRAMGVKDVRKRELEIRREREVAQRRLTEATQHLGSLRAELGMIEYSLRERGGTDSEEGKRRLTQEIEELEGKRGKLQQDLQIRNGNLEGLAAEHTKMCESEREIERKLGAARQELRDDQQMLADAERQVAGHSADMQILKEKRIDLLRQSVLDDIEVPLYGHDHKDLQDLVAAVSEASPEAALGLWELNVDFTQLSPRVREVTGGAAAKLLEEEHEAELRRVGAELERLRPNMRALEQLASAADSAEGAAQKAAEARRDMEDLEHRFEVVRQARRKCFLDCFQEVAAEINSIYNLLTSQGDDSLCGSAYLDVEDMEEPYNAGVKFTAMPPTKRFSDISLLSGGERTIAALALLFAMQAYQRPPFLVLDEVDAYLDSRNVQALARYLQEARCQTIVISLKDRLFSRSEGLVGVSMSRQTGTSVILTLDLAQIRQARAATAALQNQHIADSAPLTTSYVSSPLPLAAPPSLEAPRALSAAAGNADEDVDMEL